jgi:hypothetical protein
MRVALRKGVSVAATVASAVTAVTVIIAAAASIPISTPLTAATPVIVIAEEEFTAVAIAIPTSSVTMAKRPPVNLLAGA